MGDVTKRDQLAAFVTKYSQLIVLLIASALIAIGVAIEVGIPIGLVVAGLLMIVLTVLW